MGLGKTISALTAIDYLMYQELEVKGVLIIAPKNVVLNVWDEQIAEWPHVGHLTLSKVIGNEKQRKAAIKQKADLHIISRDNVAWLCGQYGGSALPWDMLVVDESSSFKNPNSMRFKALKKVQPSFKRVVVPDRHARTKRAHRPVAAGMAPGPGGTPGADDIRLPEAVLQPGGIQRPRRVQLQYPQRRRAGHSFADKGHLHIDEVGGLYQVARTDREHYKHKLPGEAQSAIQAIRRGEDPGAHRRHGAGQGDLRGQRGGAVHQAAPICEWRSVRRRPRRARGPWHKARRAGRHHGGRAGQTVLVAYSFQHDYKRIVSRFSRKYVLRKFETPQDRRDWNEGLIDMLLMHPASGGHGINLQAGGHIVVWFGQTWSLELEQQLNKRLHRPGQANNVIINKLVAKDTKEVDVIAAQKRKDKAQSGLLQAVKAWIKPYLKP